MSTVLPAGYGLEPWGIPTEPVRRFTVAEYHQLQELGFFGEDEAVELIEGWLVRKMTKGARHEYVLNYLDTLIAQQLPRTWLRRCQQALSLPDSELEPDIAIVAGPLQRYAMRHPQGSEAVLVIEVADVTLRRDQGAKLRSYARGGIAEYWVIDVSARCAYVYTQPQPDGRYLQQRVINAGQSLSLTIDDVTIDVTLDELFGD